MSRPCIATVAALLCFLCLFTACQKHEEPPSAVSPTAPPGQPAPEPAGAEDIRPPAPPISEDFEGDPKLSLFPRVGDFRPEDGDKEGLSYWATFIDHLVRTSGILANSDKAKGHAFGFRSIKSVDSVGFFSPLSVSPETTYRVSFRFWGKAADKERVGAGILEFDEFLWLGDQLPRTLSEKHFQGAKTGVELTGSHEGAIQSFTFRTGPKTRMIHLVFYREGTSDRNPVIIDDIEIKPE